MGKTYQRGVIPIVILVILGLFVGGAVFVSFRQSQQNTQVSQNTASPIPQPTESPSPTQPPSATSTPRQVVAKTPTPTPKLSSATCTVNFLAGDNTQSVRLVYGANYVGTNNYVAGVQWDWNGDGKWDTDTALNNGNINHTFPSNGTYNVKLRLQMSDGLFTSVCSKSVTIPYGFTVSFTGQVYRDENCNNFQEPNEGGLSGVQINFFNEPEFTLYKTLYSDSNGYFNLTATLASGQSLNLKASAVALPYYKINYSPPGASLNATQSTINKNLPLVPAENIGLCQIEF